MRILTHIFRVLMGLLFLFASITYWLDLIEPPPIEGAMKIFNDGMEASIYIMPTVKALELLCGLAFVVGRFVPLASVLISPIIVNIVLVQAFLAPEGLPIAAFLVIANLLVAYQHRETFKPLLKA
ncbi:MAG: DoxX family protein [Thermoanaerobaculia bacterium]|nr:DoxX family protein [Thermoanaerobaculia bacterium]